MSAKNEQIVRLIEQLVRKEVKEQLPKLVPQVVKEVMANMILETKTSVPSIPAYSNSEKRRSLQESYQSEEFDEYPTMQRRPMTTQQMGRMVEWAEEPRSFGGNGRELITIDAAMSSGENANPIPIRPDQIPDAVMKAMNKDYSALLDRLNIVKK